MSKTARIPLRRQDGSVRAWAIVDIFDYRWLSEWRWHVLVSRGNSYARRFRYHDGRQFPVLMHREIMSLGDWDGTTEVDHADGNGLNNTRSNLILSDRSLNARNRRKITRTSSKYRGVYYVKRTGKWGTNAKLHGKRTYFGFFDTEEEAHQAVIAGRRKLYGPSYVGADQ